MNLIETSQFKHVNLGLSPIAMTGMTCLSFILFAVYITSFSMKLNRKVGISIVYMPTMCYIHCSLRLHSRSCGLVGVRSVGGGPGR